MKQYKTLSEWKKANPLEYVKANSKGWTRELCILNGWELRTPKGYWTKEKCIEDARKYNTIKEWNACKGSAFDIAKKKGWYEECTDHMVLLKKPNGYWTKELCLEEAKKYKSRSEWAKNQSTSSVIAKKNGWFDECTKHMGVLQRLWDKESIFSEAKKHKTKHEWALASSRSSTLARKNGWYEECTAHMDIVQKPIGYWTKERCIEEARKYKSQVDFRRGNASSYQAAYNGNWMEECKDHMIITIKVKNYWTKEHCIEEARKYKNKKDWRENAISSYTSARKKGCLKECTEHMDLLIKPVGYWTKELCLEEALKYTTKTKWQRGPHSASYSSAYKNGWMDECTKHMK